MPLKTTHRRLLCFRRWCAKSSTDPNKHKHFRNCPGCMRARERFWVSLIGVVIGAGLIGALSTKAAQQAYTIPHPPPIKIHADTDRPSKKEPIAYSNDTITLTFHDCRENASHHWSCRLVEGQGDPDHYVYLPGIVPPTQYPGLGARITKNGDPQ